MGFNVSANSSEVAIVGGVTLDVMPTTYYGIGSTAINAVTNDIHTVTAGKKAIIVSMSLTTDTGGAFTGLAYLKDDNGHEFLRCECVGTASANGVAVSFPYPTGPSVAAGKKIQLQNVNASTTATACVVFVEVAA